MERRAACPFCHPQSTVLETALAYACDNKFPVNKAHTLVVARRHVPDWFDTTAKEREAMLALADKAKLLLSEAFSPDGFNLGINVGEAAGQTVFHVHLHIIPRYQGEVDNPRGGVRGVIPARQHY